MKTKIQLAMKACEPTSPAPTATMMKFNDGMMTTYGGTFCVQIPCDVDAECAISPDTLLTFFRKPRKQVVYSLNKGKLLIRQGREKVSIPCMANEEMPIIDVFRKERPVKSFVKQKAMKAMLECINPAEMRGCLQGMCLRGGLALATDGKVVLAMVSGLPKFVTCVVPVATLKFLSSLDEAVSGFATDESYIKFFFPSGMTVCSRTISAADYPDVKALINAGGTPLDMHPDLLKELNGIKCGGITVTEKGIGYKSEDGKSFGDIEMPTEGRFAFSVNKKRFDLMMSLTNNNRIFITETPCAIHADGGKFFKMTLAQMIIR
jgi:hypothetical protein|tara:strand:+ start:4112 stop:5071 length:960 start_codon:yes stop_codon:yes gene_type:complete